MLPRGLRLEVGSGGRGVALSPSLTRDAEGTAAVPSNAGAAAEQMGHPQRAAWGRGFTEGPLPRPGGRGEQEREGGGLTPLGV